MASNAQIVLMDDSPITENKGDIPVSFVKHVVHAGSMVCPAWDRISANAGRIFGPFAAIWRPLSTEILRQAKPFDRLSGFAETSEAPFKQSGDATRNQC
ncbi:hypothetical protein G6M04_06425 [Agrobacterium rhizogenes]|uniref:hypothetical protein n=1 Tax=Rhizobium rhizogenes TaxID=359 RepID=UPI0015742AC0|nr:hypothetical protein [Rhizobium rhizogenes]NTG47004.1 hypothetical protein [Rhizobium rhizogenes]